MSKLEQLIQELCPNGVEYKTLDKVCSVSTGEQLNKEKLLDSGKYPVINGGITPSGYWNDYNTEKETITISQGGASAGHVNYMQTPFWAGAHCFVVKLKSEEVNYKYLYYFIKNIEKELQQCQQGAGIPGLSRKNVYEKRIPVPPLEVQREIVHILDDFTLLTAELTAELTARKNQYDYYMDACFKSIKSTVKVKMSDVLISLKTGLNPRKFFQLNTDDAQGYYVTVRELGDRQVKYWQSKDKVNQVGLNRINERSNLEINDVLFSGTGTIGRVSLIEEKPNNWNVKEGVYILKPDTKVINPVFLMYLMKSNYMRNIYSNYIVGSPVASVPMKDLKELEFDLPSIEEQEKIVAILDRFDKLCNDISEGLPAEIEARQKQYEYYREKLLSFKEVKKYE